MEKIRDIMETDDKEIIDFMTAFAQENKKLNDKFIKLIKEFEDKE